MKQLWNKWKAVPLGWVGAVLALAVLILRWSKKIAGLELIDIPGRYPAVPTLAAFLAFLSAIALAAALYYVLRAKNDFSLQRMYLISALLVGCLYLFVLPPLSAPDEWAHYATAYKISNWMTGSEAVDEEGYIMVQTEEMAGNVHAWPTAAEYQYYWDNFLGAETDDRMIPSNQRGNETFLASYVPQALGVTLARLLGLNFTSRIMFGRIFNLIWSVIAISFAIKWMPFGKKLLFGIGMLPMTLHELASNSYDAWIIALSLLFVSYCMKLAYEKERVENSDVAMLACLIGLLGPCKIVYAPMVGLCLLIPKEKFGNIKRWVISAAIVLGTLVVMMLLVNGRILGGYLEADVADNYVSWAEEQGYTFSYFLERPIELPKIMFNTLKISGMLFLKTMIGWRLGQLDLSLQITDMFFLLLIILFLAGCIPAIDEEKMLRPGNKAWMVVLICAVGFLTMYSMLVAWTPISSDVITGVQGRYFLPVLPLMAMVVFRGGALVVRKDNTKLLSAVWVAYQVFLVAELFGQVLMA